MSNTNAQAGQQLNLFTCQQFVTELCVDALVRDDAELRAIAADLITLVRYHAARTPVRLVQS